jgi:hypothetical protein
MAYLNPHDVVFVWIEIGLSAKDCAGDLMLMDAGARIAQGALRQIKQDIAQLVGPGEVTAGNDPLDKRTALCIGWRNGHYSDAV